MSASVSTPLKPITFSPSQTQAPELTPKPVLASRVLKFSGENLKQGGPRGLWITCERIPCKVGGFGEVSKTIPEAIARYSNIDIRVVQPYLRPMAQEDEQNAGKKAHYKTQAGKNVELPLASEKTNASVTIDSPIGDITFRVRQKFEPALDEQGRLIEDPQNSYGYKGNVIYSLQDDDRIYERLQDIYYDYGKVDANKYNPEVVDKVGYDPQFKLLMLFNRAAAAILPQLNGGHSTASQEGSPLKQFNGDATFVIAHDWLTGPSLNEMPDDYKAGKVFMLHNTYDMGRDFDAVKELGLTVKPNMIPWGYYSPLATGIQASDIVIANKNYVRSITDLGLLPKSTPAVPILKSKMEQNRVIDMHHGLSPTFNPYTSEYLTKLPQDAQDFGYQQLQKASAMVSPQEAMKTFKSANKLALQKELGLQQNPNAKIFGWANRFDPNQKGFYFIMDTAEKFLLKHPDAQFVIASGNNMKLPQIDEWIAKIKNNPNLAGRLYLPNAWTESSLITRIGAGSDFIMLPSLYEPYGLSQLEGMKMGSIPVVHGVDGLSSSVLEPSVNGTAEERKKWVVPNASYGQTGFVMNPIRSVPLYQQSIANQGKLYQALTGTAELSLEDKLPEVSAQDWDTAKTALKKKGEPDSTLNWNALAQLLPGKQKESIEEAQTSFIETMERAMTVAKDPDALTQVQLNTLNYVNEAHEWKSFVPRYQQAFEKAAEIGGVPSGSKLSVQG